MYKPFIFNANFDMINPSNIENSFVVGIFYGPLREICLKYCRFFENYKTFEEFKLNVNCVSYDIYKIENLDITNEKKISEIEKEIESRYKSYDQYKKAELSRLR